MAPNAFLFRFKNFLEAREEIKKFVSLFIAGIEDNKKISFAIY